MKISKIKVENFRLLKEFSIDLEENLSLIIGKNNTGKTSFLYALDKLLKSPEKITFDDFNIELKDTIKNEVTFGKEEDKYRSLGIKLKIFIKYEKNDDLANISQVMMDLDPDNNMIVLSFEYLMNYQRFQKLVGDFADFKAKKAVEKEVTILDFLKKKHSTYFKISRKSLAYDFEIQAENEKEFIDLSKLPSEKKLLENIINFQYISAKRNVTNKETDKTLSTQTSDIYNKTESSPEQQQAIENFKNELEKTDEVLGNFYKDIFKTTIEKVRKFGGIKEDDSSILIESTLQDRELLKGNTTVMYDHHGTTLPEHNNGLGYMNLISMIFELEILLQTFKKTKEVPPSDVNLLLIEEPEAHTHPQMQYVFIKNIKTLLEEGVMREDGNNRKLQTLITTHSSHIVSESDFEDIKYLKKIDDNRVVSKNLTDLKRLYDKDPKQYQFLKQYLTLSRAEIFFADKAILIEGDTERILMPIFMKKFDKEMEKHYEEKNLKDDRLPLLSQNISLIEVGAYSQIFDKFIDFLEIKSLIITDLDTVKEIVDKEGKKKSGACKVEEGEGYSNSALKHFFNDKTLDELKSLPFGQKVLKKEEKNWNESPEGKLCIVYQCEENGYNARSFEDAFIHINREFIKDNIEQFKGMQNKKFFDDSSKDSYELADKCVTKKTHFALDILYHSDDEFSNWQIPKYISEGLIWLK